MAKGGGGSTAAGRIGEDIAAQLVKSGAKSRKLVFGQLKEALSTGNIEARIPIIQNLVEGGLQQGSQAIQVGEASIAKSGAGRTPIGQETLAGLKESASRAVAQIPSDVIGQTVRGAGETLAGPTSVATGLLGVAGGAQGASAAANASKAAATNANIGAGVGAAVAIIAAI